MVTLMKLRLVWWAKTNLLTVILFVGGGWGLVGVELTLKNPHEFVAE
jgi:hypothetical protein